MNKLTTETTPTPATPLVAEQGRPYTPGQSEAMRTPATMETAARAGSRREPRERADRILMTVLGALLGSVILGFVAIGSQLVSMQRHMHDEIGGLRNEISELRNEIGRDPQALRPITRTRRPCRSAPDPCGLRAEQRCTKRSAELRNEMRTEMGKLSDRITRIRDVPADPPLDVPGP